MKKDPVFIACPPLVDFSLPPSDHSASEPVECPRCNQKMWLSIKKKIVINLCKHSDKEVILSCYHCVDNVCKEFKDQVDKDTKIYKVDL